MNKLHLMACLAAALLLGACGEKPQTAATKKHDGKPWEASGTAYVAPGWQGGDRAAWEQQMKQRAVGQNEYNRAPASKL